MEFLNFTPNEVRVLGCLLEKQLATPDYYPMTANAVLAAANQKSSRDPVLSLTAEDVDEACRGLGRKEYTEQVRMTGGRSFKFRHRLDLRWDLGDTGDEKDREHLALLAILLLRGPQTPGQIRTRAERLFQFEDLSSVHKVLEDLMEGTEERPALVAEDHSMPGRETRYTHLLCARETGVSVQEGAEVIPMDPAEKESLTEKVETLEQRVSELEQKLNELVGE